MVQRLSLKKRLDMVRLYLNGYSHDEIARRCGVSKGTVANIIGELRNGQILEVQEPAEQLELLRELAIDLRRLKLTPGQAVSGIAIISHLQQLELEPADIGPWAAMCRELAAEGTGVQEFVQAAMALKEARERTGLDFEALEHKVHQLAEEVGHLQSLAQQLKGCEQELEELGKQRQVIVDELSELEKRLEPLRKDVIHKQKRESELSHRIDQLEQRAEAADRRLTQAREGLEALIKLGLSPDDLLGFVQRVSGIAQRHGIEPTTLRKRLLRELENLDVGLGLESLIEAKQHEVNEIERVVASAQEEITGLNAAVQQLRLEQIALRSSIAEERNHVRKEMQGIAKIARDAVARLKQELGNGVSEALLEVQRLRSEAVELGQELGRYNAVIEANQWLQTLVNLAKGDNDISAGDVRAVSLTVLRGLKGWILQNQTQISQPYWLTTHMGSAIEELEKWKV